MEARPLTTRGNKLYEFSWSMYLPLDFPIVPVRLVVAQWWEYCPARNLPCFNDSPVLAVRYIGGVLRITQDLDHKFIVLYEEKRDLRGKWLDLRFEVRFTRGLKVWFVPGWTAKKLSTICTATAVKVESAPLPSPDDSVTESQRP